MSPPTGHGEVRFDVQNATAVYGGTGQTQRYLADSDDDGPTGNHIWHQDTTGAADRMMQLQHTNGGDLLLAGTLTPNQGFDLAEAFWEEAAVEPGELVAIGLHRPDAVRPTTGAYERALLGIASTNPGIKLGGGAFTLEALEKTWGAEIANRYRAKRPELEAQVLVERPDLAAEAARLQSAGAYAASFGETLTPEALEVGFATARQTHEMLLFDAVMQRFFAESFTAVALSGRVPVKADASFGPIERGDYLTSSPAPGVAMRATEAGPVVGIALEPLRTGSGMVTVLVSRSWFPGEPSHLATR